MKIKTNYTQNVSCWFSKYFRWFEFAQKTRNPKNTIKDFESFKNEPIFKEMIDILKTETKASDYYQYVMDYAQHDEEVANMVEDIRNGAFNEVRSLINKAKAKVKEAEQKRQEAEQKRQEAEQKRQEAEQEKQKTFAMQFTVVKKMLARGSSLMEIADFLEISEDEVQNYAKMIKKGK